MAGDRPRARPRPGSAVLTLLDPDAEAFTFQTATDDPKIKATYPIGPDGKRKDPLARIINLPPDHLEALAIRNRNGAAVWVMINQGDGKGRTEANVTRARSVFCDLDGSSAQPIMACELEPHVIVETSPGKFHAYWLVDGLPLDQFEGVQRRIATMFNGDSICDLPRVMRLPGMIHAKDPAAPFMVRIVHQAERLPYPAADILRVFPPLEDGKPKGTGQRPHRSARSARRRSPRGAAGRASAAVRCAPLQEHVGT